MFFDYNNNFHTYGYSVFQIYNPVINEVGPIN